MSTGFLRSHPGWAALSPTLWRPLWLALCLILSGWMLPGQAMPPSADGVQQRSYLPDPGGALTLADIEQSQGWQPFTGPLPLRNQGIPTWVRLQVQPLAAGDWVIQVQPSQLHDLQVFQRQPDGRWEVERLGARQAYQGRTSGELALTTPYRSPPGVAATVYLRVHSPTTVAHFSVIPAALSQALDTQTHLLLGLYLGCNAAVMGLALLAWYATRESLWLLHAGFDGLTFLVVVLQMGLAAKYGFPASQGGLGTLTLYVTGLQFAAACLLFRALLQRFAAPPWCRWAYTACLALLPLQWLLIALGLGAQAMALNNLGVLGLTLWGGVVVWLVTIEDRLLRWLFKAFGSCLVAYLLVWLLPAVTPWAMPSAVSLYPTLPSNLFTMLMVLLIVARHTQLQWQRQRLLEQQQQASDLALRYEKQRHAETHSFLGMVLHELKNPLSLLRVATQHLQRDPQATPEERSMRLARMQRAVDNIDTILERCLAVDQLEQGSPALQPQWHDLSALLAQCAGQTPHGERITLALQPGVRARVDASLLQLMLRNLLDNALRYGDPHSPVHLQLHTVADPAAAPHGQTLRISVCNAPGRGGWPDPAQLFQKYYRAPTALFCSGTGLGLYWVAQVAQLMDARLYYRPQAQHIVFELCLKP